MSIKATVMSTAMPTPKRIIWRDAQGSKLPPAAEYSMAKPTDAVVASRRINSQCICHSFCRRVKLGGFRASSRTAMDAAP